MLLSIAATFVCVAATGGGPGPDQVPPCQKDIPLSDQNRSHRRRPATRRVIAASVVLAAAGAAVPLVALAARTPEAAAPATAAEAAAGSGRYFGTAVAAGK